jgi:hypothetical protein
MTYYQENKQLSIDNGVPNVAFHPSTFENQSLNPQNRTDLQRVVSDRAFRLPRVDIEDLKSPGRYNLTPTDDTDYDPNKSNTHSVMRNIHIENPLSYLFFSERNISDLKKLIKMTVYKYTDKVIDTTPETFKQELMTVMRAIYLQYGNHQPSIENASSAEEKRAILALNVQEVRRLNEIVVNDTTPRIVSQIEQYTVYLNDASTSTTQMELPYNDSSKGQMEYRSVTSVLASGNF